jgi:hypothetical protein
MHCSERSNSSGPLRVSASMRSKTTSGIHNSKSPNRYVDATRYLDNSDVYNKKMIQSGIHNNQLTTPSVELI